MASYTPARPRVAPSADLVHPLDRLKGIIRLFVAADVVLFVGLFLTLWYWLGVGVDYGLFSATGLDLARDLTPAVRIGVTLVLFVTLVALVVWRVTVLVNKDLSLTSLALVLEKRHPKLLGDRLITAIEMADVERASREGYSADMVRHTIEEARERMRRVNVAGVFNWGRLWWKGGMIVAAWVLAVVLCLAIHALGTGKVEPARGWKKMADVCGIFTERNFLFQPTPWPRRAHIEVVDFDDDGHPGELRIGKGTPTPPKVAARAVKWVVVDDPRVNADGWRAMTVGDLKAYGIAPPQGSEVTDDLRIDDAERLLNLGDDHPTLQALAAAADDLNNTRKLRKLSVPDKLKLRYDGLQTRSRTFADLLPDASGKYTGEVTNLTESVKFTVSAEDFTTARRQITLVPPPTLIDLYRDEYQPAYLHYAGPILDDQARQQLGIGSGDALYALRGRTQKLAGRKVSITSDKSVFSAPLGTELHLTAEADKDLKSIEIRPVGPNPLAVPEFLKAEAKAERRDARTGAITEESFVPMAITRPEGVAEPNERKLELARGGATGLTVAEADFDGRKLGVRRFTLKFEGKRAIRQLDKPTEFQMVMTDTDNVTSVRTIAITAVDDAPPMVEVLVDPVIRRVGGAYMVTPIARIPFLPDSKISDPEGLSSVRFEFKKEEVEAGSLVNLRAMAAAAVTANSIAPIPSWAMPATVLHSQTQFDLVYGSTIPQTDASGNAKLPGIDVPRFEAELAALQRLRLDKVDEFTVPRSDSDLADAVVRAQLAAQKISVDGMPPADFARRKAAVLAGLRADKIGELPADRGPQAVKVVKLTDPKGDAFDLQKYMPELLEKQVATGAIQKKYKLELFVVAKDVNVEQTGKDGKPAEPKSARNLDPIRLLVVSEQDLLVEIGKDEENQVQRMDDAAKKATDGKGKLDREFSLLRTLKALDAKQRADQMLSSQVRLTDIGQDLAKVRELLSAMRTEYEKLYREMDVNRFGPENMKKYRNEQGTAEELMTGYLDLLAMVLDEGKALEKTEKSVEAVRGPLAGSQEPTDAAMTQATTDYAALLGLMKRLEDQIVIGNTLNKQREIFLKIIRDQENIGVELGKEADRLRKLISQPTIILPKDVTKVAVGKTVKVKVGVRWKLYPETSLFIGVEPPATADVKVPKEIIVKAKGDEDVTEVEFEVTGGSKPGVTQVVLRPGTFKPVELTIETTK